MKELFIAILSVSLFLAFNQSPLLNPEEIVNNLSNVEAVTFNLTSGNIDLLSYTSLYENEPTFFNVIGNFMHASLYSMLVAVNTFIPLTILATSTYYAPLIVKLILAYIALHVLFFLPSFFKFLIAIYFFVKEKKYYKEKVYE